MKEVRENRKKAKNVGCLTEESIFLKKINSQNERNGGKRNRISSQQKNTELEIKTLNLSDDQSAAKFRQDKDANQAATNYKIQFDRKKGKKEGRD